MKSLSHTFLILLCFSTLLSAQSTKVMTYNIKYDNIQDTVNNWNDRKASLVQLIRNQRPSIIGIQEGLFNQVAYIDSALIKYSYSGVGREDGKKKGEYSAIFYDTTKFKILDSGTFWLSETPDKISIGWDAALERICTYGLFEDKNSKAILWVFNTHFDHIGTEARKMSIALLLEKINAFNTQDYPVVLMGDFNLEPEEQPIRMLGEFMDDALKISEKPLLGPKGTFNGFELSAPIAKRIDYIFVKDVNVQTYEHLEKRLNNGKHVSDHLPVIATFDM